MLFWILWVILTPFICLIWPTRILGKKYIKSIKHEGAILSCNHTTMMDPIIVKARVNTKIKLMAKANLFKTKFSNWFFRKVGAYPVNRNGHDIEAVKTTLTYLKQNKHISIFPEGTRVKSGEMAEFKNGLVMMAIRTNSYVIPSIFRKKTNPFVFNTYLIGKPFKFSEMDEFKDAKPDKELLQKASEILSEKMHNLKTISIKEYKKQLKYDFKKPKAL